MGYNFGNAVYIRQGIGSHNLVWFYYCNNIWRVQIGYDHNTRMKSFDCNNEQVSIFLNKFPNNPEEDEE